MRVYYFKRHLGHFSGFAGLTGVPNTRIHGRTQTTERAARVAVSRIGACMHAMRPKIYVAFSQTMLPWNGGKCEF